MRWLAQLLRWRYETHRAPAADPHIVHLDISRQDLAASATLEGEYRTAATLIRQAGDLGARVIALDAIYGRGDATIAQPLIDAIAQAKAQSRTVVLAEAMMPGAGPETERIRSFPFQERTVPAGVINVSADADGVFRHYDYALPSGGGGIEPSLALACYLAWREVPWEGGVQFPSPGTLRWEEISADFTSTEPRELKLAPCLLNFRAPWTGAGPSAFRHYTVTQLGELHRQSAASTGAKPLENAIVIISYVGAGLGDVGITPLGANQPRSQMHSTALNDLIQRQWLRRTPRWADALALAIAASIVGTVAALSRGTLPLALGWLAVIAACAALSGWLVWHTGWVPGLVAAGLFSTLASGIELARRHSFELIERMKLRATMSLYFSPHVMSRVLKNPGSMEPQEAEVTVLLTDLRNSTSIAEAFGARGTFTLLNQVFEAQTGAILAEDGSMEHFLGDQFLSYWGAPDSQPDAADRAFRAALALIAAMEKLRPTFEPKLQALFGYGVALHSGSALIGNKGSAQRLDYGLVGDLINAAARVESLTKHYGVLFLITRETFSKLSKPPRMRVIDEVVVKGKHVPLALLEVWHPHSPARFEQIATLYDPAYALYRSGNFEAAEKSFREIAEKENDRPSALLAERCRELREAPPANWSGVYEMKTK